MLATYLEIRRNSSIPESTASYKSSVPLQHPDASPGVAAPDPDRFVAGSGGHELAGSGKPDRHDGTSVPRQRPEIREPYLQDFVT
jgi:hypothetical protein